MTHTIKNENLTSNDEDVLGVFDRLKANINEIKTNSANSTRNSVERIMEPTRPPTGDPMSSRGRQSRNNSITTDQRSKPRPAVPAHTTTEDVNIHDGKKVNGRNGTSKQPESDPENRHDNRSRVESYSSRAGDTSRISTRSKANGSSETSKRTSNRHSLQPDSSGVHSSQQNRTLNRDHSHISNGRSSRTSEKSHRSSRPKGMDWSTEQFLDQYHREWMLHWQFQQQQQQQQANMTVGNQYAYSTPLYQQTVPSASSSTSLSTLAFQPNVALPQQVQKLPVQNLPVAPLAVQKLPIFTPVLRPAPGGFTQRSASRPQRPEWKGCLVSTGQSTEISRTGRTTTVLVKCSSSHSDLKDRTEMEMFPGMMLWDSPELRDRVVDFARHMSSLARETADFGVVEIESVFWDLIVHLVSRAENSRPYEVAEILTQLIQDTGRNSVASTRSIGGRDRYSESAMYEVRRHLLMGDIESAVKHAEDGSCWDLALCLQTVSSNVECKNQQANDLAIKCLDQHLQRGDPVHTICSLACGRLPDVETCFRDWVSNLAIVIACSGFVQQEDLRLRFITSLSDLLNSADMPVARDICLIFCSPMQRFTADLIFVPIGRSTELPGGQASFLEDFSLSSFFMTEVFVFLAQILQGINLHAKDDLIKMELKYVQLLLDRGMNRLASEYCRNIALVVKEYHVDISQKIYSELFGLSTACVMVEPGDVQDEWYQWLWGLFTRKPSHHAGHSRRRKSESNDSVGFAPSSRTAVQGQSYYSDERSHHENDGSVESGQQILKPSVPEMSVSRDLVPNTYSGNSRRGSFVAEDFVQYAGSRRPSEVLPSVSAVNGPVVSDHQVAPSDRSAYPPHAPLQQKSSLKSSHEEDVDEGTGVGAPLVPIQMYQPTSAASRPSMFTSFPAPGQPSTSNFLTPTSESYSPMTPGDASLNTGNAPYFSQNSPEVSQPTKFHDPTAFADEPDFLNSKSADHKKTNEEQKKSDDVKKAQHPGIFGKIFKKISFLVRGNQMHLPPDKKPTLVYDEARKKWVNTSKSAEEEDETVAPPPKVHFPQPAGSARPTPPTANMFRLNAAPPTGGYNPYSHLLASALPNPQKTFDMSNHFIPAPTIPEE